MLYNNHMIKNKLNKYFDLQDEIYKHFGYVEDWVVIPLIDATNFYWILTGEGSGDYVFFSDTKEDLEKVNESKIYSNNIYTQRFLPKWVYRADDCTMVCVDTRTDGNKFLQIFDNNKQITSPDTLNKIKNYMNNNKMLYGG